MNKKNQAVPFLIFVAIVLIIATQGLLLIPLAFMALFYYKIIKPDKADFSLITNALTLDALIKFKTTMKKSFTTLFAFVILGIILFRAISIVPAGQTGVYHLFGKVSDNELASGFHIINPLGSVELMSVRTEQYTMSIASMEGQRIGDDSIEALTKEGLKVSLDITVLFRLNEPQASDVYRELGLAYEEKILRPEVRSAIREIIALYEAKDIYSEKRDEAVQKIKTLLRDNIAPRGITVESVLLRNVKLPPMLTQAIEDKLTAEQEAQKYDFLLQRETKEAERKRIEAAGQRDAQSIINESLSDRYLQYLYIQNLEEREGTIYVPYDLPLLRNL